MDKSRSLERLLESQAEPVLQAAAEYAGQLGVSTPSDDLITAWRPLLPELAAWLAECLQDPPLPDCPPPSALVDHLAELGRTTPAAAPAMLKGLREGYAQALAEAEPHTEQQARRQRLVRRSFDRLEAQVCGGRPGTPLVLTVARDLAEREQAEEALRESEATHRELVQGLPDIVARFDRDGRHLFVSDSVREMVDLQAAHFIGKTHRELGFPAAQCRFWEETIQGVFDSGAPFETEFTFEAKRGSAIYNWRLAPERDARGAVRSVLSLSRDITERKRLVQQAESDREWSLSLLNALPGFVCLLTPDYHFRFVNKRFVDLFGDPGDQRCYEALFARDEPCEPCKSFECLRSGEPQVWEWVSPLATVYEVHDYPFLDLDGSDLVFEYGIDITARKQTEEERERERALLQTALDQAPVGILAAEAPSGRFLFSNRWVRELWRENVFSARSVQEYAQYPRFHADGRQLQLEDLPLWRALNQGEVVTEEESEFTRFDGSHGTMSANCAPVRDAEGNIQAAVVSLSDVTDRHRAEEALRGSEEAHRALVEGLPDIVMRFDRDGRYLFVSDNISEVIDRQAAQFIGKTHREMGFPEAQCRFWEEAIQGAFDSGAPFETEFTFEGKQGLAIYNWRLVPERDARGAVRSVLSLSRDITAHRRAERDYYMLFREMLNGFALCEIICDEDGNPADCRFLAVNPAFEHMIGQKAEEVVGRTVLEALPGTERYWIETFGKVALTGEPAFFENYAAELMKHFEVAAFRPAPNQFVAIFADATERKRTEGQLEASRDLTRTLLNAPAELVALLDRQGRILEANEAVARFFGKPVSELIAENFLVLLGPDLGCLAGHIGKQVVASGQPVRQEIQAADRHLMLSVYPVLDSGGEVIRVAVLAQDLTDLRHAEAAATHSQRLAAVGQLAAGVAHEFNNLLFMMSARAQLAELEPEPEHYQKLVEVVGAAVARGSQICQNRMSFARPHPPEKTVAPVTVPLETALSLAEREFANQGVHVVRDWDPQQPVLDVDTGQLQQVFLNLFLNACEAMPGGGAMTITVRGPQEGESEAWITVCVSDTGCGISEQNLPHIFEPFFTTKGALGGGRARNTGLGLAISLGLVEANNGRMSVDSALGRGTTATLQFPVALQYGPAMLEVPGRAGRDQPPGPPLRVLLVDDEPEVLAAAAALLTTGGHEVTPAAGGAEALALASEREFDVAVCDLVMPGMDGEQVLLGLRELRPGLPVLVLTGMAEEQLEQRLCAAGAAAILQKPVSRAELLQAVERAARR